MKRVLTAAMALSLIGGSAAMAQPYGHDNRNDNARYDRRDDRHDNRDNHAGRHDNRNDRAKHHRWSRGERAPVAYYNSRSRYVDYRAHHLRQPPRGYQWVRGDNNNEYLMVALATGLIAQVLSQ